MCKKPLLSLATLVLTPFVLELGYRGWSSLQGRAYSRAGARMECARILERSSGDFGVAPQVRSPAWKGERPTIPQIRNPFLGFVDRRMPQRLEEALGRVAEGPEDYFLLILGGSVASGFGNHGTGVLVERLSRSPHLAGRNVQILSFGVAAFKQPQQLNLLSYLISLGVRIDGVLNLDGFNEVAVSNANLGRGVHPLFPSSVKWLVMSLGWEHDPECVRLAAESQAFQIRTQEQAQRLLEGPWLGSALVGTLALRRVQDLGRSAEERQAAFLARAKTLEPGPGVVGPRFQGGLEETMAFCVQTWMQSSISMHAICRARGIDYLHALQPTLHDKGAKPVTEEERASGGGTRYWLEAVAHGYPRLRRAGEELDRRGVPFFDATRVFEEVEETLYFDACHFNEQGNEILADVLAGVFLEKVGTTPPLASRR